MAQFLTVATLLLLVCKIPAIPPRTRLPTVPIKEMLAMFTMFSIKQGPLTDSHCPMIPPILASLEPVQEVKIEQEESSTTFLIVITVDQPNSPTYFKAALIARLLSV